MTGRERVAAALRHEPDAPTPYHMPCSGRAQEKVAQHFGVKDIADALDDDVAWISYAVPRSEDGRDEWGVTWESAEENWGSYPTVHPIRSRDIEDYPFPDPTWPGRFADVPDKCQKHKERFRVVMWRSVLERSCFLRGMDRLLMDIVEDRRFVEALFDRVMAFNLALIRQAVRLDVDGIMLGDDYGTQHGLMMSPGHWRALLKPRMAMLFRAIRDGGKVAVLHSDGDVSEIIRDLIEIGVQVLNPVQPECMNLPRIKREFGRGIVLYGGVSTQRTLPHGTPAQVAAEVRDTARMLGRSGGCILAPAFGIQDDVPLENILALLDAARDMRGGT